MLPPKYSSGPARGGPTLLDCILVLSVIAGLGFVTVRIMDMGEPVPMTRTAATESAVVKPPPKPPGLSDVNTP